MRWRWALLFLPVCLVAPAIALAVCDGDDICEEGEDLITCGDCISASCGDDACDAGLGEDLYGTSTWCVNDCGVANGEACTANGYCSSGACCGAPEGVCVPAISCQPGETTICSYDPPRIQTCSNTCAWGSCNNDVQCVDNEDCDDTNPCTTDPCFAVSRFLA